MTSKYLVLNVSLVVDTTMCTNFMLPKVDHMTTKHLALSIRGEEIPFKRYGWRFYGQSIIRVLDRQTHTEVTLIQTDKPAYKPSQLGNNAIF